METTLNRSMAMEYSVQRISWFSSTRVSLYKSFSTGRITGSRNVRSREKTFAMKTPMGFATSTMMAKNRRICSQPLGVMSEFLRTQQRVDQVEHQEQADQKDGHVFQVHKCLTSAFRTRVCKQLPPRKTKL